MTIKEQQDEIIDEFSIFSDWMDKYAYIISLGKELPIIDLSKKTEDYIIKGCQSQVWLDGQLVDGKIIFTADSDAIITKGIIALLIRVVSNQTPNEILNNELFFIDQIGLKEHLSPTRSNGLVSMVKKMKLFALGYKAKTEN